MGHNLDSGFGLELELEQRKKKGSDKRKGVLFPLAMKQILVLNCFAIESKQEMMSNRKDCTRRTRRGKYFSSSKAGVSEIHYPAQSRVSRFERPLFYSIDSCFPSFGRTHPLLT